MNIDHVENKGDYSPVIDQLPTNVRRAGLRATAITTIAVLAVAGCNSLGTPITSVPGGSENPSSVPSGILGPSDAPTPSVTLTESPSTSPSTSPSKTPEVTNSPETEAQLRTDIENWLDGTTKVNPSERLWNPDNKTQNSLNDLSAVWVDAEVTQFSGLIVGESIINGDQLVYVGMETLNKGQYSETSSIKDRFVACFILGSTTRNTAFGEHKVITNSPYTQNLSPTVDRAMYEFPIANMAQKLDKAKGHVVVFVLGTIPLDVQQNTRNYDPARNDQLELLLKLMPDIATAPNVARLKANYPSIVNVAGEKNIALITNGNFDTAKIPLIEGIYTE